MGHDFVFGYVQAVDGEKDPRNLMAVFGLTQLVIHHLDISRFTEVCHTRAYSNRPAKDGALPAFGLGGSVSIARAIGQWEQPCAGPV
jgi:hypothetical protein